MSNPTNLLRDEEIAASRTLLADSRNLLLVGNAGVGKSHLVRVIADLFAEDGWHIARIIGSPALQRVHLGAAHSLVSPSPARTPDELFNNAANELQRGAGGNPVLLVIDDISHIDPASAALVQHLVSTGTVAIATARSEVAGDPFIVSLWKDGLFERLDLEAFDESESSALVDSCLGAQGSQQLHQAVFSLAAGNALFTRELIADAQHAGTITQRDIGSGDTEWHTAGELRAEQRVSDLFATRLAAIDTEMRAALESIALAEPLSLELARAATGATALETLEADDLITVVDGLVRSFHPLLGEVVRRDIPSLREERLVGDLIDAVVTSETSTPAEIFRAAQWQLQRGEMLAPELAVIATQQALAIFDGPTAVQCAEAALVDSSSASHAALGRALFIAQRPDEAVATLQMAKQLASNDNERAMAALALGEVLTFGAGAVDEAIGELEAALEIVVAPGDRALVAGTLGMVGALVGDFRPALRYGDELIDSPEIDDLARLQLLVIWTVAAVWTGRSDQTVERISTGIELAQAHRAVLPAALDQILCTELMHHLQAGDTRKALALASENQTAAQQEGRLTSLWEMSEAICFLLLGQGGVACDRGRKATKGHAISDPLGLASLSASVNALALAVTGDLAGALASHDHALADPRCGPREQAFLAKAQANILALEGDIDSAVEAVHNGAQRSGDNLVWASLALYEAVRFDRPNDVSAEMRAIAERAPCEWTSALHEHCEALSAADAARLGKAAERLARGGLLLYAAEAACQASRQLGLDGDEHGKSLMALRAIVFFNGCESVRSLAVEALERPLTDREFEIATAAASGEQSQSIADRLFVSRRTVDNHLQNAYRKLGVNQRDDLRAVFTIPE